MVWNRFKENLLWKIMVCNQITKFQSEKI